MASKLILKSYNVGTGELTDQWSEDVTGVPKMIRTTRENPPSKFAIATDMGEVFVCKHSGEKIYRVDLGYNPTDLDINEIGRLAVWDGTNKKLEVYDENGELKKTLTTGTTPALPHANWVAIGYKGDKVWLTADDFGARSPDVMRIDFTDLLNPSIDWQRNISVPTDYTIRAFCVSRNGKQGMFVLSGGTEAVILVEVIAGRISPPEYVGGYWVSDAGAYVSHFSGNVGFEERANLYNERSAALDNTLIAIVARNGVIYVIREDGTVGAISTHSRYSDVDLNYNGLKLVQSNGDTLEYYTCVDTAKLIYELSWYKTLANEDVPVLMTDDANYVLVVDGDTVKVFDSMGTQKYSYATLWSKKPTPFIREYT